MAHANLLITWLLVHTLNVLIRNTLSPVFAMDRLRISQIFNIFVVFQYIIIIIFDAQFLQS